MTGPDDDGGDVAWTPPTSVGESVSDADSGGFGDRARRRLGLTERGWFVVETVLLVLPYPLFVLAYLYTPVPEAPFLALTLVYSLFATYVGFRAKFPERE